MDGEVVSQPTDELAAELRRSAPEPLDHLWQTPPQLARLFRSALEFHL
ncbi:MAG: hypothetical protein ACI8T1_003140, partial [Verrucomicrobiales bacterium]